MKIYSELSLSSAVLALVAAASIALPVASQDSAESTPQSQETRAPLRLPAGQALLDFVNGVKPAVVMVIITNEAGGEVASSTGVMLEGGLVLAPRDVARSGPAGRIMLFNDQSLTINAVAAEDEETGLALLSFDMPIHLDQSMMDSVTIATEQLFAGDEVLAVSSPLGRQNYAVTPGRVIAPFAVAAEEDSFEITLPLRSNGSPLINARGEVVAVAVEGDDGTYDTVPAADVIALAVEAAESESVLLAKFHELNAPAPGAPGAEGDALKLEATIEKRPDGSSLVDGEFIIRGAGTESDPYRLTWDLLISAARAYEPRAGRNELPERITMLDGKWVELTGYLAFPLGAEESDELLLMLNQWDGCCIGVPPTPYDAVEVTLVAPYKGEAGINIFNYGTVHGLFEVDPYVTNGWLIGLYLLENATLSLDD